MRTNATTYAQALVQTALGEWLDQITEVQRRLRREPDLATALTDANSLPTERESAVGRLLPAKTAPEVAKFVRLLAQNGDLHLLEEIVRQVRYNVPALAESSNVVVSSAHELSDSEKEKLESKLRAQYGDDLRIRYEVDSDLLGGLRIRIGDRVIDHTIAAKLDALRERLVG